MGIGALVLLYALGALVPWQPAIQVENALDDSWAMVMHAAFAARWDFGRDLVFTFGPWGFLYRGYHPDTYGFLVSGWLFLSGVFLWAAWQIGHRALSGPLAALVWLVALIGVVGVGQRESFFFCLCLTPLLYYRWADERPLSPTLVLLAGALALASLVKFSNLICAAFVLGILALDIVLRRRRPPWILAVYGGGIVLFWLLAGQSPASFAPFLLHSLRVASGYSEAMSTWNAGDALNFVIPAALLIFLVAGVEWRRGRWQGTFAVAGVSGVLFLLFKAGFVRQDIWHLAIADPALAALALLLFPVVWPGLAGRRSLFVFGGVIAWSAAMASSSLAAVAQGAGLARHLIGTAAGVRRMAAARQGGVERAYQEALARLRGANPLPGAAGSVDIYPWSQNVVLAHGLRYKPRPVIQSYCAYTPELAELNARHLRDPRTAPDSIFFDIAPIDGHYPSFDDGPSWPELLTRYDIKDASGPFLLLRRADAPRPFRLTPLMDRAGRFDSPIALPAGGPVWARIDVRPTLAGRLRSILYQVPPLLLRVQTRDGAAYEHRFLPGMARAGFLLSPRIADRRAFVSLASGNGNRDLEGAAVLRFTITGILGPQKTRRFYRPDFTVRLFRLEIAPRSPSKATGARTLLASPALSATKH